MGLTSLHKSSIGKKAIVSITGLMLLGFVVGHMVGNLQIFLGQEALNNYAEALQSLGELLWVIRFVLLAVFVKHIVFALMLARENRAARPIGYAKQATREASYASRFMVVTGILVLMHVIYHLAHFTLGSVHSQYYGFEDELGRHDVYSMVVASFQDPAIALTYIAAMAALAFHLRQAASSFPQSIGIVQPATLKKFRVGGLIFSIIIFIGYSSIPAAAMLGILRMPE
ncbi:MAG: succinate dehydrogenase cytochrome b subunit [Candidatus Omnitrophica bacterium]|jgi:succinate dehydrogenase / fumarate reductase cytochrome b subunit|nr:succinate dehydrogenase cytochrome b subunit [Candidatus Omnitrophota bacterium]